LLLLLRPRRHCERSEAIQGGVSDFRAACFWMVAVMVALFAFDGRGKPSSLQDLIRRSLSNRRAGFSPRSQ